MAVPQMSGGRTEDSGGDVLGMAGDTFESVNTMLGGSSLGSCAIAESVGGSEIAIASH